MATSHLNKDRCKFVANNAAAYERRYDVGGSASRASVSKEVASIRKQIRIAKSEAGKVVKGALVNARRRTDGGSYATGLCRAKVIKVRKPKRKNEPPMCDLEFNSDGVVQKKMPTYMVSASGRVPLIVPLMPEPVMWHLNTDRHLGAINEKLQHDVAEFAKSDECPISPERMDLLMSTIYARSMASPGENVGTIGAQGIGEPSTQMTLNTFHLAGHGGANVTLGIPRLREVLMTASQDIKTPSMIMPMRSKDKADAEAVKRQLARATLQTLLTGKGGISVVEKVHRSRDGKWMRRCTIVLKLHDMALIEAEFGLDLKAIGEKVVVHYLSQLTKRIQSATNSQRKSDAAAAESAQLERENVNKKKPLPAKGSSSKGTDKRGAAESDEEDEYDSDEEDKREIEGYDDGDDDVDGDTSSDDAMSESDDSSLESGLDADVGDEVPVRRATPPLPSDDGVDIPLPKIAWSRYVACRRFRQTRKTPARIEIVYTDIASAKPLLMIDHARQAAETTVICETKSITGSYVIEDEATGGWAVQTDGCNIDALRKMLHLIDASKVKFNDVGIVLRTYGVEAARACIVQEVSRVFNAYGISVDPRHLGLVADYMTFEGQYRPLNRIGMEGSTSPFLRMTFETSSKFLVNASLFGEVDSMEAPSAQIVMGQLVRGGTGICDVLVDVAQKASPASASSGSAKLDFAEKRRRARSQSSIDFDDGGIMENGDDL